MSKTLYRCSHCRILDNESGAYRFVLEASGRLKGSGSRFAFPSMRALRESLQEDDWEGTACRCMRAWAQLDVCWGCGDGDPVEARDGKPFCEKCALTIRESLPKAAGSWR